MAPGYWGSVLEGMWVHGAAGVALHEAICKCPRNHPVCLTSRTLHVVAKGLCLSERIFLGYFVTTDV